MSHYKLVGKDAVPCELMEWAEDFGKDRTVAKSRLENGPDTAVVSTVFLGLDHQFGDGPPMIFETMVFMPGDEEPCWRYSTWSEAERGHAEAVADLESSGWTLNPISKESPHA